mgnify:CR=1 FL=1
MKSVLEGLGGEKGSRWAVCSRLATDRRLRHCCTPLDRGSAEDRCVACHSARSRVSSSKTQRREIDFSSFLFSRVSFRWIGGSRGGGGARALVSFLPPFPVTRRLFTGWPRLFGRRKGAERRQRAAFGNTLATRRWRAAEC